MFKVLGCLSRISGFGSFWVSAITAAGYTGGVNACGWGLGGGGGGAGDHPGKP